MDDCEFSDYYCPLCLQELRYRDCDNFYCEHGYVDLHEEDPSWYEPGDITKCPDCEGKGGFWWCGTDGCKVTQEQIHAAIDEQNKE